MERRLAAILAADVVGYSRLMCEDETGTLDALRGHREGLIEPKIAEHHGRIVKLMGDGMLVEFASVVGAVACAVAIQRHMGERNADVPQAKRVEFRMGINLGEVIVEDGDVYGNGVNVAARLEGLADPGGICISGAVYGEVRNRLEAAFADLGEQTVKNIAEPVRVYRLVLDAGAAERAAAQAPAPEPSPPAKASVAVLPFANMSAEPEQEYFSDGITEDIITELSRFRSLFVIARHSSFTYKNRAAKVQQVAEDLGVRYVVEGSVRRAGERVRITVQLIDATTGGHLWAERYDRHLSDIFAVQDEVTGTIAATLAGRLRAQDLERATRKPPESLQAYDYVLQAQAQIADTRDNNRRSRDLYERAIELDPACARAYAGLATTHLMDWTSGWSDSPERSITLAFESAKTALALDDADSRIHRRLGWIQLFRRKYEEANVHLKRALAINPNDADAFTYRGALLIYLGRPGEAIDSLTQARRLNPYHPAFYLWFLGLAYYANRQYEAAIEPLKEAIERNPNFLAPHRHLAACYGQLGRRGDAQGEAAAVLGLDPGFTLAGVAAKTSYKDPADLDHYLDGLRKAGLPG